MEGKEAESTPFARAHEGGRERREGGAGPSKLINEINLSAIFGGKVGKGKRGRRADCRGNMVTWNKSGRCGVDEKCLMHSWNFSTIYTSMSSNLKIGYRLR